MADDRKLILDFNGTFETIEYVLKKADFRYSKFGSGHITVINDTYQMEIERGVIIIHRKDYLKLVNKDMESLTKVLELIYGL